MRGVALGRRNWIHVGSAQAGPKVAAILSVLESCRRLQLPVREYLASVLPGLANRVYALRLGRFPSLIRSSPFHFTRKQTPFIDGVALTLTVKVSSWLDSRQQCFGGRHAAGRFTPTAALYSPW